MGAVPQGVSSLGFVNRATLYHSDILKFLKGGALGAGSDGARAGRM